MIEPAVCMESLVPKKAQCIAHTFMGLFGVDPFSLGSNAKSGQTKTCSRYTRHVAMILVQWRTIHARPIGHQASLRIGLLQKVLKGTPLQLFKKSFIDLVKTGSPHRVPGGTLGTIRLR